MSVIYLTYKTTQVSKDEIHKLQQIYYSNIVDMYNKYKNDIQEYNLELMDFEINYSNQIPERKRFVKKSIRNSILYYFKIIKNSFSKNIEDLLADNFLVFKSKHCTVAEGFPTYILIPEVGITLCIDFDLKSVVKQDYKILINSKQLIIEINDDNSVTSH